MVKRNRITTVFNARPCSLVKNFHLVWLDGNIDENNYDYCNSIMKLRQIVDTVNIFINVDECIDFIDSIQNERVILITSGTVGQTIVPIVHQMSQVDRIYIFCETKVHHETWTKDWLKIKGVFTDISPICETLKKINESLKQNAGTLDYSFVYIQILKEILLTMSFQPVHLRELFIYDREQFINNSTELQRVDMIEKEYGCQQLTSLTDSAGIKNKEAVRSIRWLRFATLLMKLQEFYNATDLFEVPLLKEDHEDENLNIFNYCGQITDKQRPGSPWQKSPI